MRAFIPLKVSAPFHSRYMREPQAEFALFLQGFTFAAPSIPVVANATACPYEPDRARDTLAIRSGARCDGWIRCCSCSTRGSRSLKKPGPAASSPS